MTKKPPYSKELIQYRMERARETLSTAQLLRDQNVDTASIVNRAYYASSTPRLPSLRPLARKHRSTVAYWRCSTGASSRRASCQKKWGNSCTPPLIRVKQGTTKTNLKSHGQWQNGWWISPFGLSIPSRKNFEIKCDFCEGDLRISFRVNPSNPRNPCTAFHLGNEKQIFAPVPADESAQMRPPCASTIARAR